MCLDLFCCCFGPAACALCACKERELRSSVVTRLLYFIFLVAVTVVCSIVLSPTVADALQGTELLCVPLTERYSHVQSFIPRIFNTTLPCDKLIGFLAVYRICMGVACFFLILTLLMLCVKSSKDPRSYIQNGFWFFKWLLVIGLVTAFFFIPDGQNFVFSKVVMAFGLTGSILFILLQLIVLVDFAHSWAENWIDKGEKSESKWWYVLMLVFIVIFYVVSAIGTILLYVFFTEPSSCALNKFFISFNFILAVVVSVVAILPWIQKAQSKSGLLQASIVTAYCTYFTWSALATEPYGTDQMTGDFYDCQLHNRTLAVFGYDKNAVATSVIGIAMLFITVAYTCFTLSTKRQIQKLCGQLEEKDNEEVTSTKEVILDYVFTSKENDEDDNSKEKKWQSNDEKEEISYSYSFFHFLMLLGILYFMVQLTNWSDPGYANTDRFQSTLASTWVKIISSWICYFIYTWTLLAPVFFGKCRDFDFS